MTTTALIRSVIRNATPGGDTTELLAGIIQRDEAAFSEAIQRFGPMVLGVCQRILGPTADAEDAFQVTFLALFRHASAIRTAAALPGWIHRTALRTARKIQARKAPASAQTEPAKCPDALEDLSWREVRGLLDEELNALPASVRGPLVLCYLEGRTRDEAASALGISTSTLKRRLSAGLERLRARLTRRGIASVGLIAALLNGTGLTAQVPYALELRVAAAGLVPEAVSLFPAVTSALRSWRGIIAAVLVTTGVVVVGSIGQPQEPVKTRPTDGDKPVRAEAPQLPRDNLNDPLPEGALARLGTSRLRGRRLTYSPDSKRVVRETSTGDLQLFEVPSGKYLAKLRGADVPERSEIVGSTIAFSPDSKLLAAVLWEGRAGIWDTDTGKLLRWIESGKFYSIVECAFSPDGKLVSIGGSTNDLVRQDSFLVSVYEVATGKKLFTEQGSNSLFSDDGRTLVMWDGYHAPNRKFRTVSVADPESRTSLILDTHVPNWTDPRFDGKSQVFQLTEEGMVRILDWKSGELKATFEGAKRGKEGGVNLLNAPGKRELIATQAEPPALFCWDIDTGKQLWHRELPAAPYWAELSRNGTTLVTPGKAGEILVLNAATGKDQAILPVNTVGHSNRSPKISPDGKVVATFTISPEPGSGTVLFWDAVTGKRLTELPGHTALIRDALFTPDGTKIRTVSNDNTLRTWDSVTGRELAKVAFPAPAQIVQSPDGRRLYASDLKGSIQVVDPTTGKVETTFAAFKKEIIGLTTTADGKRLIVAGRDAEEAGMIQVLNASTGEKLSEFDTKDNRIEQMSASADGGVIATTCAGRKLAIWSGEGKLLAESSGEGKRKPAWEQREPHYLIGSLVVLPHGNRVAFSDQEAGVGLLDYSTEKLLGHMKQPGVYFQERAARNDVRDVLAVAPDGKTLAWSGIESTADIFILEVSTQTVRHRFHGDSYPVKKLAYSPDGSKLLSTGPDGSALVWDLFGRGTKKAPAAPDAKLVASWWSGLAASEGHVADPVMRAMANRPEEALKLLREKLKPAAVAPAVVDKLIEELGDRDFATRETATKKLQELPTAEAKLARTLKQSESAEVRDRAKRILAYLRGTGSIQAERAVEVLEWIGSAESRKLLEELASDNPDTSLAQDAKSALARSRLRAK